MNYAIAAVVVYLVFAVGLKCGRRWEHELYVRGCGRVFGKRPDIMRAVLQAIEEEKSR